MKTFIAVVLLLFAAAAQAQYPSRPIKLVVPFNPGASGDLASGGAQRSPVTPEMPSLAEAGVKEIERWGRVVREARIVAD